VIGLKYSVTASFIDKKTKDYYPEGTIYETKSKERANELQSGGFLGEEVKATVTKPKNGEKDESGEV
jgi:hypothetical protein